MATPLIDEKHEKNIKLYSALLNGNEPSVTVLCKQDEKGALHELTIHQDTVLHVAIYAKKPQLVYSLLQKLPESQNHMLTAAKNNIGNTVLHEAVTSNKLILAVEEMLQRAPDLWRQKNNSGETALVSAAWFGKMKMFKLLDGEVNKRFPSEGEKKKSEGDDDDDEVKVEDEERLQFYQRNDKCTVLHVSVLAEHFELAHYIAEKHECLVNVKDSNGMTALQLLACNPSAFENGSKNYLMRLINSCVSTEDAPRRKDIVGSCFEVPLWEAIREKKKKYESAVKLAKFLIAKDTSWEATESALTSTTSPTTSRVNNAETPLFLATKWGILEIVEEVLRVYPQAVEHIDKEGHNILHVAIKYRQIHIFDFVEKLGMPMRRLIRKITNCGNSILHMVGKNADDDIAEEMHSPAILLQKDLLLFERLKKLTTIHVAKHYNSEGQTAEMLFTKNNAKNRTDAQEWLKRTAENSSIVAVLIATVAFAAAYTVPGGPNQNTGYPLLLNQSFFAIFTLTDVLSLTFALTSVIAFLSILTSSFQFKDFEQSLPEKLMLGFTLLILSVSLMMVAFAATVILLIHNNQQWTRIALYSVAFLPVCIFALSHMPLYIDLMKTFMCSIKKISQIVPRVKFLSNPTDQSLAGTSSSTPHTTLDPV